MPAPKKQTKPKAARSKRVAATSARFLIVLSTALGSVLNMIVTALTSGSVLLGLFAAKRIF
jgi:hypothetical protein